MNRSKIFLIILLFLNCPFAFAGTGSAQDGYSIIFVLAGILALIFGIPRLIEASKRMWQCIIQKIERRFNPIKKEGCQNQNLKIVYQY